MATTHTAFGKFKHYYRALRRAGLLDRVPVLLSEGDSWFSTPLYYNLVDWLEVASPSAAFSRMEDSGDEALNMFSAGNLKQIGTRLREIEFDALLISAGGNDFVGDFLASTFADAPPMGVEEALARVVKTGRFTAVYKAYEALIQTAVKARPQIQILAHSYDYPILMGEPAELSIENIGLAAFFKRRIGDWIALHVKRALPEAAEQRAFARSLIDHFWEQVLEPLRKAHPANFHLVDLRGTLPEAAHWNDEMHPNGAGFKLLAQAYRAQLRGLLDEAKRPALG